MFGKAWVPVACGAAAMIALIGLGASTALAEAPWLQPTAVPAGHAGIQVAQAQSGSGSIITLAPPKVSPYVFTAVREDGVTVLDGYVPSDDVRRALAATGADAKGLELASGTPSGFEASARAGLAILDQLEAGTLAFDGRSWSLTGTAADATSASSVDAAYAASPLKATGTKYQIKVAAGDSTGAPPVIANYDFKAAKLPAGSIALSGHLPTPGVQQMLASRFGKQIVDTTKLGSGAPEGFEAAVAAGIDALTKLDEGELVFADGKWSLTGRTASSEAASAATTTLNAAVDTSAWSLSLTAPEELPPVAEPFTWSATKSADGSYRLDGNVSNDGLKRYLGVRFGKSADALVLARGAPDGFVPDLLAGIEALDRLASGTVEFDGTRWILSGTPQTAADAEAAMAALSAARTKPGFWQTALATPLTPMAEPEPVAQGEEPAVVAATTAEAAPAAPVSNADASETVATPVASQSGPPVFSAVRTAGGAVALEGKVPAEAARSYFGVIAGGVPTDKLEIAAGLPPTFGTDASAGISALTHLTEGRLAFDGTAWSLQGTADTAAERDAAVASISSFPDWKTDIALTPPVELCRHELAEFSARNSILFKAGKAAMTDASIKSLAEVAAELAQCPDAPISVEGHTDGDGADDLNLALSVARAEAVVNQLVALGVDESRLYAVGYGETLPIAPNDTAKGKQANRRIVFTIADGNL